MMACSMMHAGVPKLTTDIHNVTQCVKRWLRTSCIRRQVEEQWFKNFLFSYMVDALFEYLFNTQLETRICSWMYGSEAQGRGPVWWYTYKSHQRMIKPWDCVRCFSQLPLGDAAGTNNPWISLVHKQRVLKFRSLYLFSGGQMSCLCSVLICTSSSFWQLGWRSSLRLGLVVFSEEEDSKGRRCRSWKLRLGVALVTNWFHQNKGSNIMCRPLSNICIFTLYHHVLQYTPVCDLN